MIPPRRQSREIALKALYQAEINNSDRIGSLKQVVADTLYAPVVETVVKEFLKSTKAQEILSGEIEDFVPDFVDSISANPHENEVDCKARLRQLLETSFPGVTVPESFIPEMASLYENLTEKLKKPAIVEDFANEIINNITNNNSVIEEAIEKIAKNWSLERMAAVDRCILKIAVSEFFYFPSIPVKATINEAIELAKKYSTDRSYEFVNGILDKISKENKFIKTDKTQSAPTKES